MKSGWLSLAALLLGACGGESDGSGDRAPQSASTGGARQAPWFEEVAKSSGLTFEHRSGHDGERYLFPEIMSGGVGILDYDGDGAFDVYMVQGGALDGPEAGQHPNRLYRNRGDGTFEDVTESSAAGDTGYGMGCACADYDGDGDTDIYVTNVGPNVLLRNEGDGTFREVGGAAGVDDDGYSASAAFLDYDADGDLDLFLVNYVRWSIESELECFNPQGGADYCSPKNYQASAPDRLFRNAGDGTFEDVSAEVGLEGAYGNGLGVTCGDFDRDGRLDVYVANDGTENQLWMQTAEGRFVDDALLSGTAVNRLGAAEAGMGVVAVDVDQDGNLDLFMSHLMGESNTFYRSRGKYFEDATDAAGLSVPSLSSTGFGLGFADFDHDGHLDLYVANGRVGTTPPNHREDDPLAEPNLVLRGAAGKFGIVPAGGTARAGVHTSRGAALGDLDGDGDVDVVVGNRDGAPYLLRNVGADGHWIQLRVRRANGADALHARVRVDAGGKEYWRSVDPHYGYCSSNDPRVHVGLGAAGRVERVLVDWSAGKTEEFGPFEADASYDLREGAGR